MDYYYYCWIELLLLLSVAHSEWADMLHWVLLLRPPAANIRILVVATHFTPATSMKNLLCDFSVRVLCLASWWQVGIFVHYATSHFMENRSLFVVLSVTLEYTACVCKWVRPIRLHLPRRVSLLSSVTHVPKRPASAANKARPNHRGLCLMTELESRLTQYATFLLWVLSSNLFDSMNNVPYNWLSP
jgi:hypothetical protein